MRNMKHSWVSIDHDLTLLFILTPQIREVRIHIKWFGKKKLFFIRIYQKSGHFYVGSVNYIIECTFNPHTLVTSVELKSRIEELYISWLMSLVLNSLAEVLILGCFFFHCLEIQKSRTSLVTDKDSRGCFAKKRDYP